MESMTRYESSHPFFDSISVEGMRVVCITQLET